MKNYIQKGDTLTLVAPYNLASGAGFAVGALFAVASFAAAAGEPVEGRVVGVYDLVKADSQAWTPGAKIYWDNAAKVCTTNAAAGANPLIGAAVLAVPGAAGNAVGRVRLNGVVA